MSGLSRYLLMFLAAVVVAVPAVVGMPTGQVMAQSTSSCTQTDATVHCSLLFTLQTSGRSNESIDIQYLSGSTWVDISSVSTATPYSINNIVRIPIGSGNYRHYVEAHIIGLDPDTTYTIRGQYSFTGLTGGVIQTLSYNSVPVSIHTLAQLPEAPEQVSVARNDDGDQATVSWVAPDSVHALTKYIIQRAELQRTSGVAVWGKETYFETTDATTLTYTDTGLDPDVTYQYQVAGVSSAGTGFYSATVRTLGAAGENDVDVDDRTYDAIPTPDHGQLPTGYDTSTGDAELVAAVDASLTQIISPTGLTWDADKMRHFLVVLGSGALAGLALVGNRKLGNRINGQSILLAFLLFQATLWLGALMLGFPWHWAMLPTLMTVGLGLIASLKKVTA